MLRSLNTATTGIRQFQTNLDVIGNNLANINTIGYKAGRVDFADTLTQTLRQPTPDLGGRSGTASVQVGNGVNISAVKNTFTQGAINQTGVFTDLAINGEGFFLVKNTFTGEVFATRAGDFRLDDQGFLVTNQGFRVQGFNTSLESNSDYPANSQVGDIKLDRGSLPAGFDPVADGVGVKNVNIDSSGRINILLDDNKTQYTRGQILLERFNNPQALLKQGSNLYSGLDAAGRLDAPAVAGTNGLGQIEANAIEMANVDIAREFSTLITTQRAFQANARVLTASDEVLQEMIRMVR
jgi:flagellar hook protein FlgE